MMETPTTMMGALLNASMRKATFVTRPWATPFAKKFAAMGLTSDTTIATMATMSLEMVALLLAVLSLELTALLTLLERLCAHLFAVTRLSSARKAAMMETIATATVAHLHAQWRRDGPVSLLMVVTASALRSAGMDLTLASTNAMTVTLRTVMVAHQSA